MDSSPFKMDPNVLESNLFLNQTGKKGKVQLCPNFLPHLFYYVKTLLSETERNSLKDYEAQVFIIETAIGPKKFNDLNLLSDFIIKEIRGDIKYWIKGTEPFMKVYEDLKKIGGNDEKMDVVILSMKEENENAFQEFREYYQNLGNICNEVNKDSLSNKDSKEKPDIKGTTEETIEPTIEKHIPENMSFKYETYETVVDNYYSNKNESYYKKVRTRWQDKRDKRLLDYPQEVVKNYVNMFKEVRDNDPNFANSIFVCNRNFKIPRIEIQLFPLIFQFMMKKYHIKTETTTSDQVFLFQRIQNLIYLCLMTDDRTYTISSQGRVYKGAFLENFNASKTLNEIEEEQEGDEEEEKKEEEDDDGTMQEEDVGEGSVSTNQEDTLSILLSEFKQFSHQEGLDINILFGNDREIRQRKFSLLNNTLRICNIFLEKLGKWELSVIPSLEAQDATFDNFKIRDLITKLDSFEYYSDSVLESIIDYYHLEHEHKNIIQYIEGLQHYKYYTLKSNMVKDEKEEMQGVFSDKKFCLVSIENYQDYFNSPTIAKKRSYIFHTSHRRKFSQEECRKFLEGLYKYYDTPVNNKKIAKHIGPHIKSNHIRFIKARYIRRLRKKANADNVPIRDLLKEDLSNNNIKDVIECL